MAPQSVLEACAMADSRSLHGRTAIYSDVDEVTAQNVADVVDKAKRTHDANSADISYLYGYYKGSQPILDREKVYNTEINNKIVENRAREISDFKTGYLLSAPIQYIDMAANDSSETAENSALGQLSAWMDEEGKEAADMEIAFWQSVCGTAFRMLSPKDPDAMATTDEDPSPFEIFTLDPRYTFVVYSSKLSHKPLLGVTYVEDENGDITYFCYTDTLMMTIDPNGGVTTESHMLGRVPIIEYPHGISREGDFEPVVPILDAINTVQSNRVDGVEQLVQAILVLKGMDIGDSADEKQTFLTMLHELGGLQLPEDGDASYLTLDLDQTQTQTLVDSLYDAALKICGMPNPKSGYNTSDTGAAVILRDGWSSAEAVATRTEIWFKRSERQFLDMAIDFCNNVSSLNLAHRDVGIRFPRRNYTNDTANVDNLIKMLSSEWIPPEMAAEHSNLTPDPHAMWLRMKAWHDQQEQSAVDSIMGSGEAQQDGQQQEQAQQQEQQAEE